MQNIKDHEMDYICLFKSLQKILKSPHNRFFLYIYILSINYAPNKQKEYLQKR